MHAWHTFADADDDGEHEGNNSVVRDDGTNGDRHSIDSEEERHLTIGTDSGDDLVGEDLREFGLVDRLAQSKGEGDR